MKTMALILAVGIMAACLSACENDRTVLSEADKNETESTTAQTETAAENLYSIEAEKPAITEFKAVLEEIDGNIYADTVENSPICVKTAAHLMNWGVGTPLTVEEIRTAAVNWLSDMDNDEQIEFSYKLERVYETYRELLGPNAEEMLKAAECNDAAYPWSDTSLETIEAVAEAVENICE